MANWPCIAFFGNMCWPAGWALAEEVVKPLEISTPSLSICVSKMPVVNLAKYICSQIEKGAKNLFLKLEMNAT